MGSYYVVLVGPEPTHVCKSGQPQVCDNLNLLAECWAYSPVQFGKVVVCEDPEFIIQGSFPGQPCFLQFSLCFGSPSNTKHSSSLLGHTGFLCLPAAVTRNMLVSLISFSHLCVQSRVSRVWMTCKKVLLPCDPVFLTTDRRRRAEV